MNGLLIARQAKATASSSPVKATPAQLLTSLVNLAAIVGWGKISLGGDLASGKEITLAIKNCPFCAQLGVTGEESCEFYERVSQGVIDEWYGVSHDVRDPQCRAKEGDVCEIVVRAK